MKENPEDEEVGKAMKEVQVKLKRQRGESQDMKTMISNNNVGGAHVVAISSDQHFRDCITSPGK